MAHLYAHPIAQSVAAPLLSLAVAAAVVLPRPATPPPGGSPPADVLAGVVRSAPGTDLYLAAAAYPDAAGRLPVDDVEGGDDGPGANIDAGEAHAPAPPPAGDAAPAAAATTTADWLGGLGPIEPYAAYEPQRTCSPTAKPGTVQVRDALLATYRGTRNLGIVRACHVGARSEHKEGRAFDWGAYAGRSHERAAVERFLQQLLATDADGNRHALARRMGVMYVIWNRRIWSQGTWRPYRGASPHTDHLHLSLGWDGARGRTSFFALGLAAAGVLGQVPEGVAAASPVVADADEPRAPSPGRTSAPAPEKPHAADHGPRPGPRRDRNPRTEEPEAEPDAPAPAPAPAPEPARDRGHDRQRERDPARDERPRGRGRAREPQQETVGEHEAVPERGEPAKRQGGRQGGPDDRGRGRRDH